MQEYLALHILSASDRNGESNQEPSYYKYKNNKIIKGTKKWLYFWNPRDHTKYIKLESQFIGDKDWI